VVLPQGKKSGGFWKRSVSIPVGPDIIPIKVCVDFIPLFENATILVVHKNNPLCKKTAVRLEDLNNKVFLSGSTEYYAINRLFLICKFLGFTPTIKHITENILFIAKLVAHNQGVFLCPDSSIQYFDHPDIRFLPFEDDPKIFSVYLVTRKKSAFI
jgi:DNA-binding transcriptional LysR family regulator